MSLVTTNSSSVSSTSSQSISSGNLSISPSTYGSSHYLSPILNGQQPLLRPIMTTQPPLYSPLLAPQQHSYIMPPHSSPSGSSFSNFGDPVRSGFGDILSTDVNCREGRSGIQHASRTCDLRDARQFGMDSCHKSFTLQSNSVDGSNVGQYAGPCAEPVRSAETRAQEMPKVAVCSEENNVSRGWDSVSSCGSITSHNGLHSGTHSYPYGHSYSDCRLEGSSWNKNVPVVGNTSCIEGLFQETQIENCHSKNSSKSSHGLPVSVHTGSTANESSSRSYEYPTLPNNQLPTFIPYLAPLSYYETRTDCRLQHQSAQPPQQLMAEVSCAVESSPTNQHKSSKQTSNMVNTGRQCSQKQKLPESSNMLELKSQDDPCMSHEMQGKSLQSCDQETKKCLPVRNHQGTQVPPFCLLCSGSLNSAQNSSDDIYSVQPSQVDLVMTVMSKVTVLEKLEIIMGAPVPLNLLSSNSICSKCLHLINEIDLLDHQLHHFRKFVVSQLETVYQRNGIRLPSCQRRYNSNYSNFVESTHQQLQLLSPQSNQLQIPFSLAQQIEGHIQQLDCMKSHFQQQAQQPQGQMPQCAGPQQSAGHHGSLHHSVQQAESQQVNISVQCISTFQQQGQLQQMQSGSWQQEDFGTYYSIPLIHGNLQEQNISNLNVPPPPPSPAPPLHPRSATNSHFHYGTHHISGQTSSDDNQSVIQVTSKDSSFVTNKKVNPVPELSYQSGISRNPTSQGIHKGKPSMKVANKCMTSSSVHCSKLDTSKSTSDACEIDIEHLECPVMSSDTRSLTTNLTHIDYKLKNSHSKSTAEKVGAVGLTVDTPNLKEASDNKGSEFSHCVQESKLESVNLTEMQKHNEDVGVTQSCPSFSESVSCDHSSLPLSPSLPPLPPSPLDGLRNVQDATEYHKPTLLGKNIKTKKHAKLQICRQCDQVFSNHPALVRHIKRRHKAHTLHFNCDTCNKKFSSERAFSRHIKLHKMYSCKRCSESLLKWGKSKELCEEHSKQTKHCKTCGKECNSLPALIAHTKTHTVGNKKKQCETCKKLFANKRNLIIHQRIHSGEKPYYCDNCSRGFNHKSNMIVHRQSCKQEYKYLCVTCGKGFVLESLYNRHIGEHDGHYAHTCNICNKGFGKLSGLKAHMETHRSDESSVGYCNLPKETCKKSRTVATNIKEASTVCPVCGKKLARQDQLSDHMNRHTGNRPYSCRHCSTTFFYRSNMNHHIRTVHHQVRPYSCNFCDRSFPTTHSWKLHQRTHTKERPFSCKICGKAFTTKANYTRHLKCHITQPQIESREM